MQILPKDCLWKAEELIGAITWLLMIYFACFKNWQLVGACLIPVAFITFKRCRRIQQWKK